MFNTPTEIKNAGMQTLARIPLILLPLVLLLLSLDRGNVIVASVTLTELLSAKSRAPQHLSD